MNTVGEEVIEKPYPIHLSPYFENKNWKEASMCTTNIIKRFKVLLLEIFIRIRYYVWIIIDIS